MVITYCSIYQYCSSPPDTGPYTKQTDQPTTAHVGSMQYTTPSTSIVKSMASRYVYISQINNNNPHISYHM